MLNIMIPSNAQVITIVRIFFFFITIHYLLIKSPQTKCHSKRKESILGKALHVLSPV
jgi:preprotein translocase subunit YajC